MNAFVSIAGEGHRHQSAAVAAALRAAVDQVLPDCQEPGLGTCDIDLYTEHQRKRSALLAIAALADEPAVPEGREPASVTGEPSDAEGPSIEDVEELCEEHCFNVEGYESIECLQGLINEAIARWGHQPAPPADGEVASVTGEPSDEELESFLLDVAAENGDIYWAEPLVLARAVLTRYGRQPAPPAESVDRSHISDGYHTFAELYDHRHSLALALMRALPDVCWFSQRHNDGELPFGSADWFIVGADLPAGAITYHLPIELLSLAQQTGAAELSVGRPWDGHTANDVIERLRAWAASPQPAPAPAEGELTDEELENAARAAEIQNMKYQGGLSASDPNGIARQLQKQRLAGLRAVATLAADRSRRPAPAPMNNVPSERDVSEWIDSLPLWHGATRDDLTGIVMRALKHWGRPTALLEQHQQVAPVPVDELMAAYRAGVADAAQALEPASAAMIPMEYVHLDFDGWIVREPSEEGPGGCWRVLNSRFVSPFTEFPTAEAACNALQAAHALPLPSGEGNNG